MTGKQFFKLEARGETFTLTLKANCHGFRRGDCGWWPMLYDEADTEIKAGARLVGQALCLCRDFDGEVQQ
jgi:hypothetical protein